MLLWVRESYGRTTLEAVQDQTAKFLDNARAKALTYTDWTAAWRLWMRNWKTEFGRLDPKAVKLKSDPNSRYGELK